MGESKEDCSGVLIPGLSEKVSRNLFLKETAKRIQEQLMISQIENVSETENTVENEVELNLLLEEVERIISLLPPARQRVYRLKHIELLSQKEIASQLGISENTVESHLKQSTKFLTQMLKVNRADLLNDIVLLLYPIFHSYFKKTMSRQLELLDKFYDNKATESENVS